MKSTKIGVLATFTPQTGEGTVHIDGEIYFFDTSMLHGFNSKKFSIFDNMRVLGIVGEEVDVLIENGLIKEIYV